MIQDQDDPWLPPPQDTPEARSTDLVLGLVIFFILVFILIVASVAPHDGPASSQGIPTRAR